ncbi:MAG: sensor histidine kinase [Acidobacteria bacterium]|nr:MAG: sensor histidine kinase [Acidobacteriota bacterium]REK02696.1 MAG: sensor histidine kinase [Acidobacteriota bacterium]REK13499.1 MAG: sensor histidine kinase [Acidobacteriota bacterium]REK41493.1 MAG: sensor histidine kinase [Acidobacteriota bacterium]
MHYKIKGTTRKQRGPSKALVRKSALGATVLGLALLLVTSVLILLRFLEPSSGLLFVTGLILGLSLIIALGLQSWAEGTTRNDERRVRSLEGQVATLSEKLRILTNYTVDDESASRQLIASLSHDVRTSLNALSGWAKILERQQLSDKLRETALDGIDRSIKRQLALLEEASEYLALEEEGKVAMLDKVKSEDLLAGVVEEVSPSAESRHVEMAVIDDAQRALNCDAEKLQTALNKILRTVVRHTPVGGKLLVRANPALEGLSISIKNSRENGTDDFPFRSLPGISRGEISAADESAGTGLSLAISKKIIEMHGGKIAVEESNSGLGTEVRVVLPKNESV